MSDTLPHPKNPGHTAECVLCDEALTSGREQTRRDAPRFTASKDASFEVLMLRIETAFTYPHGHPGIPGVPEGEGCPRCNAEWALQELAWRSKR